MQRLMGYSMGAYAPGCIDDARDPIVARRDGTDTEPASSLMMQ